MIIKGGSVCSFGNGFEKKDIMVEGSIIKKIDGEIDAHGEEVIDASNYYVLPGFIDIHTHGGNGNDTMDATYEALDNMSKFYASKGVTACLPTTMTAPIKDIVKALENIRDTVKRGTSGATILGVNLEGPFISKKYKGSHPEEYIVSPSIELIEGFIEKSGDNIRVMTIAPELDGVDEIIEHFKGRNIVFSAGHTAVNYKEGMKAFEKGFNHVTHLFNAMMGIHHREPGFTGAALDNDQVTVELICDGIHINPAVIRMVVKCKTCGRVALITDSTMAAGLEDGEYTLGFEKIFVKNGEARLENGVLAGSTLTLIDAVKNMVNKFGISLEETIQMATLVPAKAIHVDDRKGSIDVGKDADLVILDKDLNVVKTIVMGRVVFSAK
ncbi:N-acetylglucosamine-6-phosphate deacetylase [Pseudoclostridium thermosuccinogenes]|uniref:N-acetylglucosamine-6-phosphate deacetylase n=1 Tax=Clostridium thermosuccinogenes TaxID=84032 RepID=UPI002FD9156A